MIPIDMTVGIKNVLMKIPGFLCGHEIRSSTRAISTIPSPAIAPIASQLGQIGVPNRSAYCTTKAGLIHLTTILASEVARDNIRVNSISPGVIQTPRTLRRFNKAEDFQASRGPLHMLGRVGQPEEVAKAALFLASDDASFTTATDILVDGGYIYLKRQPE